MERVDEVRRLKRLEPKHSKLKRLASELNLEELMMGHIASRNFYAPSDAESGRSYRGSGHRLAPARPNGEADTRHAALSTTPREDANGLTRVIIDLAGQYGRYGCRCRAALAWDNGWDVSRDRVESIVTPRKKTCRRGPFSLP